jgi:MFS family permease
LSFYLKSAAVFLLTLKTPLFREIPMSTAAPNLRQDAKVIGLVGVAHAVSHFFHLILAPLFPWLKDAFSLSYAELGFLMTVFFIVSGVGQALAGFVVDRLSARVVLFFGMGCLVVSALALSLAQNYPMLLAGSMLAGLGNSVFHPSDFTLLNKRVSHSRLAHAFSVHGISGNLGWAAAPIFLAGIASVSTWRTALFAAAFLPLAVLLLLVVCRDLWVTEAAQASVAGAHPEVLPKIDLFGFLRSPAIWMCFAFFVINAFALGGIQSFSSTSLRELYGMPLAWATTGFTAYMLASAMGMVCGGFAAAKIDRPDRIIALALAASGVMAMLIAAGVVPALAAVMLMGGVGFGAGVAGPSRDLLIRAAAPKNATGRVYGVVYSGNDIGLAISPLMFGAMMDGSHPAWVFILIGGFQFLAILTAIQVGSNTARKNARGALPA